MISVCCCCGTVKLLLLGGGGELTSPPAPFTSAAYAFLVLVKNTARAAGGEMGERLPP